ncbi:MAG: hypothetical protein ABID40_02720 [Candidatus Bipolaricaulota bacterium]
MRLFLVAALLVVPLGGFAIAAEELDLAGLGGGGMLVGLLPLDLSSLNAALTAAGYPALDGQLIVVGGGGAGGILGGPVFGGLGFGGGLTSLSTDKRTDLELGFGGVMVEAARRAGKGVLVGFGAVLGGGGLDLTARSRYPTDFADALAEPTLSQFSLGFVGGLAYLRLQIQVLDWLAFEGWLGYFLAFPGQWEEGGREIAGPKLELRVPFLGLRITFGGVGAPEDVKIPDEEPK